MYALSKEFMHKRTLAGDLFCDKVKMEAANFCLQLSRDHFKK